MTTPRPVTSKIKIFTSFISLFFGQQSRSMAYFAPEKCLTYLEDNQEMIKNSQFDKKAKIIIISWHFTNATRHLVIRYFKCRL